MIWNKNKHVFHTEENTTFFFLQWIREVGFTYVIYREQFFSNYVKML